ncbi:hypothetical protein GGR58DRAFT_487526 [Xylaria digitata]|nr:hypothetical protein GGR58DRAFT_487526 [Xylaria digitata]
MYNYISKIPTDQDQVNVCTLWRRVSPLSGHMFPPGAESMVPDREPTTTQELKERRSNSYVGTAAAVDTGVEFAVRTANIERPIYGADYSTPCCEFNGIGLSCGGVELRSI